MKTARKIALIYSLIAICLVLIAGIFIWFFVSKYSTNVFYSLLEQKALSVAMLKYEKDELPKEKYENLVLKSQENLAISEEMIIDVSNDAMLHQKLGKYLKEDQIHSLLKGHKQYFTNGKLLGCVIYYEDNEGNFAVSVTASNIYAEKINKTFLIVLLCILVFTSLILYLASRLYAIRILENKEKIYQKQKLFIDGASHEINNPLAAISGQCEVTLLKDRTVEQYKQTVSNVYNQTQRITDIIKNLLLFSKTENIKTDTQNMQTFLLSAFLEQFKSQNVSINIEKDAQVCANKELLSLAVGNIIGNAEKFSSDGKAYVTLNGNILRVKNSGKGIAKEDLPHIFEPFYRGKTAMAIHGHGIGLALSKSIFDDMKADVRVNSEPEKGAEFVIKLP